MIANSVEAYELLHRGARALSQVESNGIRIDELYLAHAITDVQKCIKQLERELLESRIGRKWRSKYSWRMKLGSRAQLADVLQRCLDIELPKTEAGNLRADEDVLLKIKDPFVEKYLKLVSWKKTGSTYLEGISREVCNGFLHPFFHLHTTVTYRSSSDKINFQNIPTRDKEMASIIRRCFIPRKGRMLVEIDYGGIEVRMAACYTEDPVLLKYMRDPTTDMHRDMAAQCFLLDDEDVTKDIRYSAKNQFVFPQFYGDWYWHCAQQLWESVIVGKLKTKAGIVVAEHLRKHDIDSLGSRDAREGTFAGHIERVERDFWGKRFKVYAQWKERWVAQYAKKGYLRMLTGFICRGLRDKRQIINYGFQGTAFHCLLWSLNRLVLNEIPRARCRAMVVGQIHDSLLNDVPVEEVDDYLELAEEVMTNQLPKEWEWIIVPLVVESTRYEKSWAEKVG